MFHRQSVCAAACALALLLNPLAAGHVDAASAEKIWEVSGLDNPESAKADADTAAIYVSNVAGAPTDKDGNGYISKLSLAGEMVKQKWAAGLNAPKGLAIADGKLFTADIDELVAIDLATGNVGKTYAAPGAKFLNDVAADSDGRIYVSDMAANTIWRLEGDTFSKWLDSADLLSPNGLLVQGDNLIVAAWGKMTDGFATKVPGHLLTVSLAEKTIASLGSGEAVGNLDGLEALDDTTYLVTDWMAGNLMTIDKAGASKELLDLNSGSADIGYLADKRIVLVPMMKDGTLAAYQLP
jgi:hypothetical protein